jgi:hypothetical protein
MVAAMMAAHFFASKIAAFLTQFDRFFAPFLGNFPRISRQSACKKFRDFLWPFLLYSLQVMLRDKDLRGALLTKIPFPRPHLNHAWTRINTDFLSMKYPKNSESGAEANKDKEGSSATGHF